MFFWFPRSSVGTRFAPLQRSYAALECRCMHSHAGAWEREHQLRVNNYDNTDH